MAVEFLDGVRSQPEYLAASRETVRAALDDAGLSVLRDGTTVVLGIGASGHAATAFAARLRSRGARAYAMSSGDAPPAPADCHLAISYSGRSRETVELLAGLGPPGERQPARPEPPPGGLRVGVTGHPEAPLAGVVDRLVPLGGATDTAVSTLSYTATVQALGLLADHVWGTPAPYWPDLPGHAATLLADPTTGDRIASTLAGVTGVDVIGEGPRTGSAGAAALLLREAAHLPAASYSLREYLHGPLEVAAPGHGTLIFGAGAAARLAERTAAWGSPTVLVTTGLVRADGPVVVPLPDLPGPAIDVLDILPVQLAAAELAARNGVPIALRHMPADTKLR